MKVYILIGFKRNDNKDCWEPANHSIHSSKSDALSEYGVEKALGKWEYDDYDIEEHDF